MTNVLFDTSNLTAGDRNVIANTLLLVTEAFEAPLMIQFATAVVAESVVDDVEWDLAQMRTVALGMSKGVELVQVMLDNPPDDVTYEEMAQAEANGQRVRAAASKIQDLYSAHEEE